MKNASPVIDALEMSRQLRVKTGTKLRAMTREERLDYLHQRLAQFKKRLRRKKESLAPV